MHFTQGFLKNPKRVGGIFPSSRFLAAKTVQSIPWNEVKAIAELGSGTGAITTHINTHLTDSAKLFLFERDKKMRENLKVKYPGSMFHSNASYLIKKMNQESVHQLDCIISGLPFSNFSNGIKENILHQIIKALRPGGYLVAYHCSRRMKKKFAEQLILEKSEFVRWNFPPSFVYIFRKK
ncbi:class I SAM-dependent methyltransferase [Paenibacillus sp. Leaf72]|uniref:class I SAM-dependent methyltransferase n=1 Tax=Paenibacillus sp. Leaf72 TaxID=1736234 RepID=UPI0006FAAEA5|nr:methyltransferase domain-containing protein [Paenibacillus sp. Leaf72]KQN99933.1 phospholipid methyltransferase [Paenibacillus sp. Leaf72]